jgi:AcrR family transcriptional regulator
MSDEGPVGGGVPSEATAEHRRPGLRAVPGAELPVTKLAWMPSSESEDRRPVGRPRLDAAAPAQSDRSPRDEIVAAATKLFAERGYAQTTMSDIARAVGLQQSSLYYWFRRKELILQEALVVNRAPLDFIGRVGAGSGSPALKLYRLLRYDTRQLALSPIDFNEIERIAENQQDEFVEFWRDYTRLHEWVASLVRAAIDEGLFITCDPAETATGLLCFNEGVQKRYRYQARHEPGTGNPFVHEPLSAERWAELVAVTAVRSLLRRPADIGRIQRQASAFDDR